MSAPVIFIVAPILLALFVWAIHKQTVLAHLLAAGGCFFLAILALTVPVGARVPLGPLSFEIGTTMSFLGRRLVISPGDRSFIFFLYLFGGLWFFSGWVKQVRVAFPVFGLIILALMVAALAVEPFLYAALLIEMAALLSVPMLVPPGAVIPQGILRFLVFQTLAVPFILLAGWTASIVDANPSDTGMLIQALVLMGLGFSFWLGVFPFNTWIPMLVAESNAFISGFLLSVLPTTVLMIAADFFNSFTWFREAALIPQAFRLVGVITVVTGGLWAAFQPDPRRMFGYAVIIENGFALLAISLNNASGWVLFATLFLPRMVTLLVWSLANAALYKDDGVIRGAMWRRPFAAVALILSVFSVAGVPLLAGFSVRMALFDQLAITAFPQVVWMFIGSLGLLVGALQIIFDLVADRTEAKVQEYWVDALLLAVGALAIIAIGLFPRVFLNGMGDLLEAFQQLL
ncbi:MAG: hypothetical protein HPY76_14280 [Anaerolineae bacterium]|nr:hypothetical protein [Anaerolineae bacterium]